MKKQKSLSREELAALMIAQGIIANPELHASFWKNYESEAKAIGAAEAAANIERSIAYRAARVAKYVLEMSP